MNQTDLNWKPPNVEAIAQHCNDRRLAAKAVSDTSALMFLALFIRQSGSVNVEGIVIKVSDYSMDCVLSNMGITKRVFVNRNENIESFEYLKFGDNLALKIKWKGSDKVQNLALFDTVQLCLEPHEKLTFEYNARLVKPA